MGKRQNRDLASRLTVLVMHLLKWGYQPARRSPSWRQTIQEQRRQLACIGISNGILPQCSLAAATRGQTRRRRCTTRSGCSGEVIRPACFLLIPSAILCLYTARMCRMVGDSSWHFHHFPPGRGGSYGASCCHLRTPGPKPHGALSSDCRPSRDLSCLVRG